MGWKSSHRSGYFAKVDRKKSKRSPFCPRLEMLEDRTVPALINWSNRADFDSEYGGQTALARRVIDEAILHWESVIDSFNYRKVGQKGYAPQNSYQLSIDVKDWQSQPNESGTLARGGPNGIDRDGKPWSGSITLDDNAAGGTWYFDPNPGQDFEFTKPVRTYAAVEGPSGSDLYSVVLHEIGHALGFSDNSSLAIQSRINQNNIFTFNDKSTVTFDPDRAHFLDARHPNDLMTPSIAPSMRKNISDLSARVLAEAYGYTINWNVIGFRSFITTFNPDTRLLHVHGDLGTSYETTRVFDDIKLDVFTGGYIFTIVNGTVQRISQDAVSSIFIDGQQGNDEVRIGGTAAGQEVLVNAGRGENTVFLSYSARNLSTIQGDVKVIEEEGRTAVNLHDENATAPRMFNANGTNVKFSGSSANILYRYADPKSNPYSLVLRGGIHGNTYSISDIFPDADTIFFLQSGKGADTVNITDTVREVFVEGNGGRDTITVGRSSVGMTNILGSIYVSNSSPFSNLILNDSGSFAPDSNVQVTETSVTGLSPAPINFDRGELASLTIKTGHGGDSVFIGNVATGLANLPASIYVEDAEGADRLTIRASSAVLDFNRRQFMGIVVPVPTEGRLTNYPLSFAGIEILDLIGVGDAATANLIANPIGLSTLVESFRTVNVGDGNADNIHGNVTISTVAVGHSFPTSLTVNDALASKPKTIQVGVNEVAGVAENTINFAHARISQLTVNGGLGGPNEDGVPAGNHFILHDTRSAAQTGSYVLNTGAGSMGDTVEIRRSSTSLTVNGQRGRDAVIIGHGNMDGITASLLVTNQGNWSDVTLDDRNDSTGDTVLMQNSGQYTIINGLSLGTIRLRSRDLASLNILAGTGFNGFTIDNTPQSTIPGGATTTITGGPDNDNFSVRRTRGPLNINGMGGTNTFVVGAFPVGSLNSIDGEIRLSGTGGVNSLNVSDDFTTSTLAMPTYSYIVDDDVIQRIDKAPIYYQDIGFLNVFTSQAADNVTVRGTKPDTGANTYTYLGTTVFGESDTISVEATTGQLYLAAGNQSVINVGTATSSLDNIQGLVRINPSANNDMLLRFNDTAATSHRLTKVSGNAQGQTFQRSVGEAAWRTFAIVYNSPVANVEYQGGSGGTTFFVDSTSPNTFTTLFGHSGTLDTFALGFAANMNQMFGAVLSVGQAADNDFAYYYEYLNPTPQNYTIYNTVFILEIMVVERPGIAPMGFLGMPQVVFYNPLVGGNTVNMQSVPAGTFLNMVSGENDVVTMGSNAPNLGGSLVGIQGPVQVASYQYTEPGGVDLPLTYQGAVTLIVDNSGNVDPTPRSATLDVFDSPPNYYESLVGLAPAGLYWNLGPRSSVSILGSAADDTFEMRSTNFDTPINIDGGGGINTLDYSTRSDGVYVNLLTQDATGLNTVSNIDNVIGSTGNDIIVGTGGNTFNGGAGRDLLIAGAFASVLIGGDDHDLLIGGTTDYDTNQSALDAIMTEWSRNDNGYGERVNNLLTGNGAPALNDATIHRNGGLNQLTGGLGDDLFFAQLVTELLDLAESDQWVPV